MLRKNESASSINAATSSVNRRTFAARLAILVPSLSLGGSALASSKSSPALPAAEEITHSGDAIHQEVTFNASPARLYDVLTDAKQFDKVIQLSAAMKSMAITSKPSTISREPGGAFSLFGGYITGRQIELVPAQRIVQAWRSASWEPGAYSIARFELSAQNSGAKLVFDHSGFPAGQADHLLAGWNGNYWEPLAKVLSESK